VLQPEVLKALAAALLSPNECLQTLREVAHASMTYSPAAAPRAQQPSTQQQAIVQLQGIPAAQQQQQ